MVQYKITEDIIQRIVFGDLLANFDSTTIMTDQKFGEFLRIFTKITPKWALWATEGEFGQILREELLHI
jgi:hypothetical protein